MAGRKALKIAVVAVVVGVCLVLLWLVAAPAYASRRQRQVEKDWVQSFGTLQHLLARYPKTDTNETAHRLEELVKPLGLDLTPRDPEESIRGASRESSSADREWPALSPYLSSQLEKAEAAIDAPPVDVERFLTSHANDLRVLEEELLRSEPPRWNFDPAFRWRFEPVSLSKRQPIPSFLAMLKLQRVFLAKALVECRAVNSDAAGRALDASWKLNQWMRETPDLMCQLIALAIARMQIGTLRKVEVDASVWRPRLTEHDYKQSAFDTQLRDLWPSPDRYRELEEIKSRSEKSALKRLENRFEEPYANIVWSDATEKMRLAYLRIKASPVMGKDLWDETYGPEKNASDILVAIQMPNMVDCFKRVDRLVIESELTDKVLQARQLRHENNLKWPPFVPGIEATRFPDAKWIYSVSSEGAMSLSLSKEPKWNASGLVLPVRFSSS
jgi:hypothetical protein